MPPDTDSGLGPDGRTDSGGTAAHGTHREHGGRNDRRLGAVVTIHQRNDEAGGLAPEEHHFTQDEYHRDTSDNIQVRETQTALPISPFINLSIDVSISVLIMFL